MADYNRVKIGTIYLTDDGTDTGMPCRVEVGNLLRLRLAKTGVIRRAANGKPYPYTQDNAGLGLQIPIRPFAIMKDVLDAVITELSAAAATGATINVTIEGDTGDYDLDCYILADDIEAPGTFSEEQIDGVVLTFTIAEMNP